MSWVAPLIAGAGLTASAYAAGLAAAYPLIISPLFGHKHVGQGVDPPSLTPSLSTVQRLTVWDRAYHLGFAVPRSVLAGAVSWAALYAVNTKAAHLASAKVQPHWKWLGAGALLQLSTLPWTVALILPVNYRLIALRRRANEGTAVSEDEVETLLGRWQNLHIFRVVANTAGFAAMALSFLL
ncbi:unnamed protein product [Parajaminaea phylloscopi]